MGDGSKGLRVVMGVATIQGLRATVTNAVMTRTTASTTTAATACSAAASTNNCYQRPLDVGWVSSVPIGDRQRQRSFAGCMQ